MSLIEKIKKIFTKESLEYKTHKEAKDEYMNNYGKTATEYSDKLEEARREGKTTDELREIVKEEQEKLSTIEEEYLNYDEKDEVKEARKKLIKQLPSDLLEDIKYKIFLNKLGEEIKETEEQNININKEKVINNLKEKSLSEKSEYIIPEKADILEDVEKLNNFKKKAKMFAVGVTFTLAIAASFFIKEAHDVRQARIEQAMETNTVMAQNDYQVVPDENGEFSNNFEKINLLTPYEYGCYVGFEEAEDYVRYLGYEDGWESFLEYHGYSSFQKYVKEEDEKLMKKLENDEPLIDYENRMENQYNLKEKDDSSKDLNNMLASMEEQIKNDIPKEDNPTIGGK